MSEERIKITVVALGAVILSGNKLGLKFSRAEEIGGIWTTTGREMLFDRKVKRTMGGSPGTMYTVDATPDATSIYSGTAEWIGRWANVAESVEWQGRSRATEAEHAATLSVKEKEKHSELIASLALARTAYRRSVGTNRQQLLAIMVEYITRG